MLFWIVSAVITAAAAVALIGPLFRSRRAVSGRDSEIAIYRDQLAELERDIDRGVLPAGEAESARTEIARRLLRASEAKDRAAAGDDGRRRVATWVAVLVVPIVALGGYLALGEPGTEDRPIEERRANPSEDDLYAWIDALGDSPSAEQVAGLAPLVETALERDPNNAGLLQIAAITRLRAGEIDAATVAYLTMMDQVTDAEEADSGGELGINIGFLQLARGEVTADGVELIELVADAFPANGLSMINLALLRESAGDTDGAIAVLQTLLDREPPGGAQWSTIVRQLLAELGVEAAPVEGAAPSSEAMAPILEMTPEEQLAFIEEMVGQLAARLEADPNDPEGWARLITSYIVLEREDDAEAALERAREVFTGNDEALQLIEEAAAPLTEQQ